MPWPLTDIVRAIKTVRPWPPIAARVLEIAAQPEAVPGDVVAVVRTDAVLTAKVLKLANSAYYGFQHEVDSLLDAANKLGLSALVQLVVTSCASQTLREDGGEDTGRRLWERSVRCAVAAGVIARETGVVEPDRAYTAALLENLGELVVEQHLDRFRDAVEERVEAGEERLEAERRVLGLDHAVIGARLARQWGLPDALVDAIGFHHRPEEARSEPLLTAVGGLAEALTEALERGGDLGAVSYDLSEKALRLTGLDRERLAALAPAVEAEVERARDMIEAV